MPRSKATIVPVSPPASPVSHPKPSMVQTVKEGFSFGVGSSLARHFVDRLMGGPSGRVDPAPCEQQRKSFENCILAEENEMYCGDKKANLQACLKLS